MNKELEDMLGWMALAFSKIADNLEHVDEYDFQVLDDAICEIAAVAMDVEKRGTEVKMLEEMWKK